MVDLPAMKLARAPPYNTDCLFRLEERINRRGATSGVILLASAILLTVHTSLRLSDIQPHGALGVADSVLHGTLISCVTKRQHGSPWPSAAPKMGFS